MDLEERFWNKVNILGKNDCWEWQASLNNAGYGNFKYNGNIIGSHRMVWFLTYGEFPRLFVLHKCDNRKCCNPNHLFLGTNQDNMNDMINKGRSAKGNKSSYKLHPESYLRGENHPQHKLSNFDVEKIKELSKNGIGGRKLSQMFGVYEGHISNIIHGRRR